VEARRRAGAFVLGLLAGLPRVNCWSIAEHAGDRTPSGMQHLLSRGAWDADGIRDDLRGYVTEHLGGPDGMLVAGETGDVKKGTATRRSRPSLNSRCGWPAGRWMPGLPRAG
jgi:SRSO17 transposase